MDQKPQAESCRRDKFRLWVLLVAVLLSTLVYLPTVRYGFVWDDHYLVEENEFLAHASLFEILTKGFWHNPAQNESLMQQTYYRPLVNMSFFLERKLWGLNPNGYHLTNVIVHAANVALVGLIVWELLRSAELAGAAALIFGLHPALNSVVAFIANRTYLLCSLMVLFSFYILLRGRRQRSGAIQLPPRQVRQGHGLGTRQVVSLGLPVLSAAGLLLGFLAHEVALAYLVIVAGWLVLDRREYLHPGVWGKVFGLAFAGYAALRFLVARVRLPSEGTQVLTLPLLVLNSFGQQMNLLFVPFIQKVTYSDTLALRSLSGYTALGLLYLVVPLLLAVRFRSQSVRLGAGWMILFLLPFAQVMTLGPSGRMLYLPALGGLLLVTGLLKRIRSPSSQLRLAGWVLLVVCSAAFAVQTMSRNSVWQSEDRLNRVKVAEAPDSPQAHDNLGCKLREAGDIEGAIREHRRAIALKGDFATAHNNLGTALFEANRVTEAAAEYREALRLQPDFAMAHNNLGVALQLTGDLVGAEAEYRQAVRLQPGLPLASNNLGEILMQRGQLDSAEALFRQALTSQPSYALARFNLGLVAERRSLLEEAEQEYRRVLQLMPDFRPAQEAMERIAQRTGD